MKRFIHYLVITSLLFFGGFFERCNEAQAGEQDWPQWRGPLGTGFAPESDPPVEWSETKNVRWKVALPGKGHSTPIVPGDRIFLTTAIPYGELLPPKYNTTPGTHDGEPVTQRHEFVVLAISRREGTVLWQKSVYKKLPYEGGHNTASLASNSAVTDGTCPVPLALHTPYMNLRRVTVKLASRRIPRSGG